MKSIFEMSAKERAEEMRSIDKQIKELQEKRSMGSDVDGSIALLTQRWNDIQTLEDKESSESFVDTRDMKLTAEEKEEEELRNFIATGETRSLTTQSQGSVIATHLYQKVVKLLDETAPLFSQIPLIPSKSGHLEIPIEKYVEDKTGFVGEEELLQFGDLAFDKVKLEQKRCGSAMKITQQLINDSELDILKYSTEKLFRNLGKRLDKAIVSGEKVEQFEGLVNAPVDCDIYTQSKGAVGIDDFMDVLNDMHEELQDGAVWVMSKKLFNYIAKLKDGNGNYFMLRQLNVVTNKPEYSLFGCRIFKSDEMDMTGDGGETLAYLVNFSRAYKGMIKKGVNFKHIDDDTQNALAGTTTLVIDIYADAKIVDKQAIRTLKRKNEV